MSEGRVEAIFVREAPDAPPRALQRAEVVAGKGIVGDRYFTQVGTYSATPGSGRALTLIEAEALEALERDAGIRLAAAESRRNLVTRGIALNELVGKRFRVGALECLGTRLCEPCDYLDRLTTPGVLKALVHRGGLRADVLGDAEIAVGDVVSEIR